MTSIKELADYFYSTPRDTTLKITGAALLEHFDVEGVDPDEIYEVNAEGEIRWTGLDEPSEPTS